MTARQLFEYALIELNKVQAPSLILEDYNYFINKAVNQYINRVYSLYDINQQKSDDLRVLKSTAVLIPNPIVPNNQYNNNPLLAKAYEVDLPDDYLHVLNCVVEYNVKKAFKCYDTGDYVHFGAKRLTADMFSQIINNYYMRPQYKNPYYYINNVNLTNTFPTLDSQYTLSFNSDILEFEEGFFVTTYGDSFSPTPGYYCVSSNNYIKLKTNKEPAALNFHELIQGTIPGIRMSGESDYLTSLGHSTPKYFSQKGIKRGSLIVGTSAAVAPSVKGSATGYIVLDVITDLDTGLESLLLDNDGDILGHTEALHYYNYPQIEFLGYAENVVGATKIAEERYGNKSKVRMEIRYGKDDSLFKLSRVYVDYLKSPQFIRLTQDQVDNVEDKSQMLEFPDYVCQEITNELIKLLMENGSDPRLQTNIPVNQSIANPAQEQQPQQRR